MNLEIGIASYRNPEKLKRTLDTIHANTVQPFKLHVWHNQSGDAEDEAAMRVILDSGALKSFGPNVGYAGAVNGLLAASTAPYFLYCDNDIDVRTRGWDERLMEVLEQNPECAQVFPGAGHHGFFNGRYHECLWNAGYCWMLRRSVIDYEYMYVQQRWPGTLEPRGMDRTLGHHEEVDLMIRLRLAGFTIGACPSVDVLHHATATNSPESEARIRRGVILWMEKWNKYFCGEVFKYPDPDDPKSVYDPRMLRYTDWPPCALYLERWTLAQFPGWNKGEWIDGHTRVVETTAGPMDAVEILKPKGPYRGRAI